MQRLAKRLASTQLMRNLASNRLICEAGAMDAPAQFSKILNDQLSVQAWLNPRLSSLPGVQPLSRADWLLHDEVFAAQMAYRDWLLEHRREAVFAQTEPASEAAEELRDLIIDECSFERNGDIIQRADGVRVDVSADTALVTAARLTQTDLCILQDADEEHILAAGVLCFPSSWTLAQKIGRSLASIHSSVDDYDERVATSVQRMFKAIRIEQPLWRANFLIYTDAQLHQPRAEGIAKPMDKDAPPYVRVERQSFRRLPKSLAVVFGIHTSVVSATTLSKDEYEVLRRFKPELS